MQCDSDGVARWDAGQTLAVQVLRSISRRGGRCNGRWIRASPRHLRVLLSRSPADPAMIAQMLALPGEAYLAELAETIDPVAIHHARKDARSALASRAAPRAAGLLRAQPPRLAYRVEAADVARRSLRNVCLSYLLLLDDAQCRDAGPQQYYAQDNMTDVLAALTAMVQQRQRRRARASRELLDDFHTRWRDEALAMNLWFQVQAHAPRRRHAGGCEAPARQRGLRRAQSEQGARAARGLSSIRTPAAFHRADHAAYRFFAEQVARSMR
jgi:aminopeptidase N